MKRNDRKIFFSKKQTKKFYDKIKINLKASFNSLLNSELYQKQYKYMLFISAFILLILLILLASPELSSSTFGFYIKLFIITLPPICILLIAITEISVFKTFSKLLWVKFTYSVILYFTFICAYRWSEITINEVMPLNAKFYPYATKILILEYFNYLFASIGEMYLILIAIFILVNILLNIKGYLNKINHLIHFMIIALTIIYMSGSNSFFQLRKNFIVQKIAVDFDFNETSLCPNGPQSSRTKSLRIDDSKILQASETKSFSFIFNIVDCNLIKTDNK